MPKWARELEPTDGNIVKANNKGRRRVTTMNLLQEVMDLPAANAGLYEMKENEIRKFRSRLYSLNRDNAFGWKWRTLVENKGNVYQLLLVWRIH